jgi:hypothetical protein
MVKIADFSIIQQNKHQTCQPCHRVIKIKNCTSDSVFVGLNNGGGETLPNIDTAPAGNYNEGEKNSR